MTDPLHLSTGSTTILDIPLPGAGTWTRAIPVQSRELERTDTHAVPVQPEIPEAIPAGYPPNETPPSFDWTAHEEVGYQLQVRMTDLEAWLQLRNKYGSPNNLIALINSDLVILGTGQPFPYVEEFA